MGGVLKRDFVRTYVVTAAALLFLDWLLLWSRFLQATLAKVTEGLFWILNFPWSIPYLWLERQANPWWRRTFGEPLYVVLNDELGPMIVLILIVLVQALLFALVITKLKKRPSP
jgi:hypothetical protein